jgi:hypothetical protein
MGFKNQRSGIKHQNSVILREAKRSRRIHKKLTAKEKPASLRGAKATKQSRKTASRGDAKKESPLSKGGAAEGGGGLLSVDCASLIHPTNLRFAQTIIFSCLSCFSWLTIFLRVFA